MLDQKAPFQFLASEYDSQGLRCEQGNQAVSSRVKNLLQAFHAARPEVFAERAVLVTRAYERTEGQPILLRRAEAMEEILTGSTVLIRH